MGELAAEIPLTSLGADPVSLRIGEVLVTVRPRASGAGTRDQEPGRAAAGSDGRKSGGGEGAGGGATEGGTEGSAPLQAGDLEALGQAAVVDGVRLIAGGIEDVLQRLRVEVHIYVPYLPLRTSLVQQLY